MSTSTRQTALPDLAPQIGVKYALLPQHVLLTLWFAALFLHLNYVPLYHTDLWGHVAYGNWILDQRALPQEDPFTPLAEGVPITCTAWLGQVVLAQAGRWLGHEGYSTVFALTGLVTALLLGRIFWLQTRSYLMVLAGTGIVFFVGFTRHAIIRPEIFGNLCFATILWLIIREETQVNWRTRLQGFCAIPVVMGLWANLHGSFVVGLAILGLDLLGRALEVVWKAPNPLYAFTDRALVRKLLIVELATLATMVNPYGWELLVHSLVFPTNPNLNDVLEWFRLEMISAEGYTVGASWALMAVVLRHGRVTLKPRDVLWLSLLTVAVCLRVRMISWYAPIFAVVMVPQLHDIRQRILAWVNDRLSEWRKPEWLNPSFHATLLCLLIVWVAFTVAPCSTPVFGGSGRAEKHLYSKETPRALTDYLRKHPPTGQIMNPQWWGDYLSLAGPPGLRVFMTTNAVHVAPQKVWKDYLDLARGRDGFERRLDLYRINTIVVHTALQPYLAQLVKGLVGWSVVYEDELGFVAQRKQGPAASLN